METIDTGFLCSITNASRFSINKKSEKGQQELFEFFVAVRITDVTSIWSLQALDYSNVYNIKKDMKNFTILVLFVLLTVTLTLRLHEQKVAPSEAEHEPSSKNTAPTSNTKAPTSTSTKEEPAPTATKKPAAQAEPEKSQKYAAKTQPEAPAKSSAKSQPATPSKTAEPAAPAKSSAKAEPAAPAKPAVAAAASPTSDLTPDELKQYNAWLDTLIPWAPFQNGQDSSKALDGEFDKTIGLAKINEIKSKRQSK